jgi:hypothetical protein
MGLGFDYSSDEAAASLNQVVRLEHILGDLSDLTGCLPEERDWKRVSRGWLEGIMSIPFRRQIESDKEFLRPWSNLVSKSFTDGVRLPIARHKGHFARRWNPVSSKTNLSKSLTKSLMLCEELSLGRPMGRFQPPGPATGLIDHGIRRSRQAHRWVR